MKNNEKAIDYLEAHIPELAAAAVKQAYWQTLASGASVLVSDDGVVADFFGNRHKYRIIRRFLAHLFEIFIV